MLTLRFSPASDRAALAAAAAEYRRLWDADGERIVACLEGLTGLRFAEAALEASVDERPSQSHPLVLRASYDAETKGGALVHELGHRLLSGNRARLGLPRAQPEQLLENHQLLDLFLFDAWIDRYGEAVARRLVGVESAWRPAYAEAWAWALSLDRPVRAAELRRRLGR